MLRLPVHFATVVLAFASSFLRRSLPYAEVLLIDAIRSSGMWVLSAVAPGISVIAFGWLR